MTSPAELDPVPVCPTCAHEHSATWTGGKLTATGPCYCGCLIETRATLTDHDHDRVWLDDCGRVWEWDDINGWVVDGMATVGGFWPEDAQPPIRVFTWVRVNPYATAGL